jgi:outer membrane protein TolC
MRPRALKAAAAAAAAAILSACTVGPDYLRPGAPVPARFKEAQYKEAAAPPRGWKLGQPSDAISRGEWWTIYNDPVLDGLEARIDISNQNLKAFAAAFREAEFIVAEARAGFFPTGTVSASGQRSKSGGGGSNGSGSVSAGGGAGNITDFFST